MDEAQPGDVLRLTPGTYTENVEVVDKHDLRILGEIGVYLHGSIDLRRVAHIEVGQIAMFFSTGSAIGMEWKPKNGEYQQRDIFIHDIHIQECGAGLGIIGYDIAVERVRANTLIQKGGDMDFCRVWGERIKFRLCEFDGKNSQLTTAHADGFQCYALSDDKWLHDATFEDCSMFGGSSTNIHQGFMFEASDGRVSNLNINNCRFENIQNNAIIMRGIEAMVRDCTFIDCTPGKAENSDGRIISINKHTHIISGVENERGFKFNEVNNGTVVYLDSEPTPTPQPQDGFPIELNESNPTATVLIDAPKGTEQLEEPALLWLDVYDADFVDEAILSVNGFSRV